MKKLVLLAVALALIAPAATFAAKKEKTMKIAFFVSDLSNVFHQAQYAEAKAYAKEKYNAEVFAFDGKSDSAVMTANIDQVVAQGMDAATLHIWDQEAGKPGVNAALKKKIIMTSFFSPCADTGIPTARSDEKGTSFAMGAEMAKQWKAAFPNKPIVMVQLGWPNHTEVKSGRTDPFVQGVLSVDPKATNLGCQDASKGPDAAKQIILDLVTQHPEVNLIYSEASNLTVGTMAGLEWSGTADNLLKFLHYGLVNLVSTVTAHLGFPFFPTVCCACKKTAFRKAGGFDEDLAIAEDLKFSLRMGKIGKCLVSRRAKAYTSLRRIQKNGMIKNSYMYLSNYFKVFVLNKRPWITDFPHISETKDGRLIS